MKVFPYELADRRALALSHLIPSTPWLLDGDKIEPFANRVNEVQVDIVRPERCNECRTIAVSENAS